MIISLSGLIGSGKNAVAEYLVKEHGFVQDSFAASLKDAVAAIFGWDRTMLEGSTKEARDEREKVDQWWANRLGIPHLSPRWALQYFGTDVCRNHFHNDIWLASVENRLRKKTGEKVVISDSRFFNELDMLRNVGATIAVVQRGVVPDWWKIAQTAHVNPESYLIMQQSTIHPSEWDWAGYQFDTVIDNNKTLYDLYQIADTLVKNRL